MPLDPEEQLLYDLLTAALQSFSNGLAATLSSSSSQSAADEVGTQHLIQADDNITWERLAVIQNQLIYLTLQFQQSQQVLNSLYLQPPTAVLPAVPPPAYVPPATGDVADAVWNALSFNRAERRGDELDFASVLAQQTLVQGAVVGREGLYFQVENISGSLAAASITDNSPPAPNWGNILPDDTLLAFLSREWGGTWHTDVNNGTVYTYDNEAHPATLFRCTVDPATFAWLKARSAGAAATIVPPVWPGLSGVSLGSTTALSDGLVITTPMDGIIVHLTAVPPYAQKVFYGAVENWAHLGALSFQSDNGLQEEFQYLGFADVVYCPRVLERAYGVVFRAKPGVVGTVQTWLTA